MCPVSDSRCAGAHACSVLNNNVFTMGPIQLDPAFNLDSSAATLTIPPDSTVLWQGSAGPRHEQRRGRLVRRGRRVRHRAQDGPAPSAGQSSPARIPVFTG